MKSSHGLLILTAIFFLNSCNTKKENSPYDRKPILENLSDSIIIPAYKNAYHEIQKLDSSTKTFISHANPSTLATLKAQWKQTAIAWKRAEVYNFGPIRTMLLVNSIHYWPIDTASIEKAISDYDHQDNYLGSLGSHVKGIATLEYLLFQDSEMETIRKFSSNKRKDYIKLITKNLIQNVKRVVAKWENEYGRKFCERSGTQVNSSLTKVTNQWISLLETIKTKKVGVPSGLLGSPDYDVSLLESPYANYSAELLKANILELQKAFNGNESHGIDDYLYSLRVKDVKGRFLNTKINDQFQETLQNINTLKPSLRAAIFDHQDELNSLYLNLINLTILLKTEMMSQLDLVTTFSDNDGD